MKINESASMDLKIIKELEKLGWKSGNAIYKINQKTAKIKGKIKK